MKIKKYNSFIKESLEISLDRNGNPNCPFNDIKHGEVSYDNLPNLNPGTVDDFISEIIRCIEVNHEVLATDLSDRVEKSIKEFMGKYYDKYYFTPVDEKEDSPTSVFRYNDLSLALAKLINLGYTVGYLRQKYNVRGWNYSKFFGYKGERFTSDEDFKKLSSDSLNYDGPDIDHYSLLAGSFDIRETLSDENIEYRVEEQGDREISMIFPRAFSYGFDSGAKMCDLEEELHYNKIGTTKERYDFLLLKKDKTQEEEEEFDKYTREEDILKYGEEKVLKWDKQKSEYDLLPEEEKERRKKKADEELEKILREISKGK